jgi:hypothetical protein
MAKMNTAVSSISNESQNDDGMSRRDFMKLGALGVTGAIVAAAVTAPSGPSSSQNNPESTAIPSIDENLDSENTIEIYRYHESIDSYNQFVAEEEASLGWSERDPNEPFGDDFIKERGELRLPNNHRTLGFVISDKMVSDCEAQGLNAFHVVNDHCEELNRLYREAGIDLHYTLTGVDVIPDEELGSHRDMEHIVKKGIDTNGGQNTVNYPRYQDTTWVLTSDCNDNDFPNYVDKLVNRGVIDKGLIHELIHHTGIGDFYHANKHFDPTNNNGMKVYRCDYLGYMSGGLSEQISPWEQLFINEFLKNGTFSPQHDGIVDELVDPRTGELAYHGSLAEGSRYKFNVLDRQSTLISESIDGMYVAPPRASDQQYDSLFGVNGFSLESGSIVTPVISELDEHIIASHGDSPINYFFKAQRQPGIILPVDKNLMLAAYILQNGAEEISLWVYLDPSVEELYGPYAIFCDVLKREPEIPTQVNGNKVYGYSELSDDYRAVWYVQSMR